MPCTKLHYIYNLGHHFFPHRVKLLKGLFPINKRGKKVPMVQSGYLYGIGKNNGRVPPLNSHNISNGNNDTGDPPKDICIKAYMFLANVKSTLNQNLSIESARVSFDSLVHETKVKYTFE